ncbi:hypothetical protein [Cesiribacter andamanensis]|uniref:Uncharacterized protein n=1 Tax=Cesiribacter andamanensis AMV16 TaxID=1279009 RepID=M7N9B8_9BACT|nr:hypothetical protein [Cesiribacter andamanensis]EMR03776.1 hypothetical protein ADICEAN_01114 [Cesiribacter andamanensis AMV16]
MKSSLEFTKSAQDSAYLRELQQLVQQKVAGLPPQRLQLARVRALLLPALYFLLYALALLLRNNPLCYLLLFGAMGACLVLIF